MITKIRLIIKVLKMKKNIKIIMLATLFTAISCKDDRSIDKFIEMQEKIDSLKQVNSKLEFEINKSIKEKDSLIELVKKSQKKSNSSSNSNNKSNSNNSKYYSEQEAIGYVKDYYSFYKKNYLVQNIKVRRISNNIFHVSLEEESRNILKIKKNIARLEETDLVWDSSNYKLTIYNSKEYKLE